MLHTILTHPGGAHKDDVLAVALLASQSGARIVRRVPTPEDLADPGVAVVDIGGVHDPSAANFDHHHFPREHPPTCALSLVLQDLDLYDDALRFCPWLETAEWFDSRGPKKTAQWLGVPREAVSRLHSPIDGTLLRRFAAKPEHVPGEPVYEFMRYVGEDLVDYLHQIRRRIAFVGEHGARWSIPVGDDVVEAVFLPRTDPLPEEPSGSVMAYVRAEELQETVAAIVYPDRRGPGYGIQRYEDHPKLDFGRVSDEPDVHFAHTSGFVCKTTALEPTRLQALIAAAWETGP